MFKTGQKPDFLFEISWEVCNKIGGVHTAISSKAQTLLDEVNNNLVTIGPDVWRASRENPEFKEDPGLYSAWKKETEKQGLRLKIGRWQIKGKPIAILVDFTTFINEKDKIFTKLWEDYELDSLSGQWDYVEPCLFGYAAGKVIESFCRFNLFVRDKVVAQFHQWLTGTGILYLKKNMPQVGTVFTAHSTVLGREIAGSGLPLYSEIQNFKPESQAQEFHVKSKQSLEKLSAQNADIFTTVSDITAKECNLFLGKEPDLITPNGFEDSFVPAQEKFVQKRAIAREKLFQVADKLFATSHNQAEYLLIATSGRNEIRNKGFDLFLESLGKVSCENPAKKMIAFILVPANNYGADPCLIKKLKGEEEEAKCSKYLTHGLHDEDSNQIIQKLKEYNFNNEEQAKIKVIYVPAFLDGFDGIFDLKYYDLLSGFDLTLFLSYYEPWGYTPLESLAFKVPTVTTSLSGFGHWIKDEYANGQYSACVVERNDNNYQEVISSVSRYLCEFSRLNEVELSRARENAGEIAKTALWRNLIKYYRKVYASSLEKVDKRAKVFSSQVPANVQQRIPTPKKFNEPVWNKILIEVNLPDSLKPLQELSRNIWWTWDCQAQELFREIEPELWEECHNPIVILEKVTYKRFLELENDDDFMADLKLIYGNFKSYMEKSTKEVKPQIAYFSMEYGLHDTLKIFSGGLGILAGDYMKEASDNGQNIVGIGLLYRFGYFSQGLSQHGEQLAIYENQSFSRMPIEPVRNEKGIWQEISISLPGRICFARIWQVNIGRNKLYLLDCDYDKNSEQDRKITHRLYGGDHENRLKQELILGIGGIRLLNRLKIDAELYHSNEGHSAFIGLERIKNYIKNYNLTFDEAKEIVRASTLFTTHTPVPAGHDAFSEDLLRTYLAHYSPLIKISWEELMNLGRIHPDNTNEKFNMSFLAANLSQEVNGVSKLHGKISQYLFKDMWAGYYPEENHIGYVTNGVHYPSWTAKAWKELFIEHFGADYQDRVNENEMWKKVYKIPAKDIWELRSYQRYQMLNYLKIRMKDYLIKRHETPSTYFNIIEKINPNALTIGFARRFATYKRAHLLFTNMERLAKIVNNEDRPVQFLFAGKAHPNDKAGQDLIKKIIEISKMKEFNGKVIFFENYDIELAKKLVQGVDIWLNTPTRPLEASGTSGMKAVMNGGLHFSVLDGWWCEGYEQGAGWALDEERTYPNQHFQNELDAETIYSLLENEIIPLFYDRGNEDIPLKWIDYIKKSLAEVAPKFTTKRMQDNYISKFYSKLHKRTLKLKLNNFEIVKHLSSWKKRVAHHWDDISVVSINRTEPEDLRYKLGEKYYGNVVLDLKGLNADDIGVEMVIADSTDIEEIKIISKKELDLIRTEGSVATYNLEIYPLKPGPYNYGLRIFPKNPNLPHRIDLPYVRWIG